MSTRFSSELVHRIYLQEKSSDQAYLLKYFYEFEEYFENQEQRERVIEDLFKVCESEGSKKRDDSKA